MKSVLKNLALFLIISITFLSCSSYQVRNDMGFGGIFNPKLSTISKSNTIRNLQSVDTIKIKLNESISITKSNTIERYSGKIKDSFSNLKFSRLNNQINQKSNPSTIKIFKKIILIEKSKSRIKNKTLLKQFLPNKKSNWTYWLIFSAFILTLLLGCFYLVPGLILKDNAQITIGIFVLLYSILYLFGLFDYKNFGCNTIHDIGYVLSLIPITLILFAGIPLYLWANGSEMC